MLETKYLGDKLEMLVTDFAIFEKHRINLEKQHCHHRLCRTVKGTFCHQPSANSI